ncbi:MAG: EF-hand domain-containing protein [Phycisphaerales bacterium]|nr:EF-hand domain-containing protein [Planctomycetota bacterium]MCH8507715.1 EF-hand domain-containing protein [Phycisphaerales bacterium]
MIAFGQKSPQEAAALPAPTTQSFAMTEPMPGRTFIPSTPETAPGGQWDSQFDWDAFQSLSPEERRERMEAMRAQWEERMASWDGELDDENLNALLESPMGRRLLDRFDADGDGILSEEERQALQEEIQNRRDRWEARMIERYDRDGDGVLSERERRAMMRDQQRQRERQMQRMLAEFDRDGDGELDADERALAWQTMRERREIDAFVRRFDSTGDGRITTADFNAFLVLYHAGDPRADVNRDGSVDTLDITAFRDMMTRAANRP